MRIHDEGIYFQSVRRLYWTRIFFESDNSTKTTVIAAASLEYLDDFYRIAGKNKLTKGNFDDWIRRVTDKWETQGDTIFKLPIHYDTYANTPDGEANIMDYLLTLSKGN